MGGGIYASAGSSPIITNCIIWNNGDDLFGCSATYSCVSDGDPGEGNIPFYPHFVDPEAGDYRLLPWSPCIDAGDPSSPFSLEPEPNGGRINMGAYGNTPQAASMGLGPGFDDLPDDWEIHYFGHLDYGGMDDPDGDGILNVDEYRFGWNPTVSSAAPIRNLTAGRSYELIQPAIAMATPGDEIVVQPARYVKNVDFLGKAATLRSTNPSDAAVVAATILDGGGRGSVVGFTRGEGRDSVLSGFTITGGLAKRGAGIFCENSSPTISDNVIRGNLAPDFPDTAGCGVYCYSGSPLLIRNIIEGNETWEDGSAVYVESGSPTIIGNVIRKGWGGWGGGICVLECASAIIERNVITGNRAGRGAGVYVRAGQAYVANNVVTANHASGWGGGICYRQEKSTTIINNTVVGNSAGDYGGGHCCPVQFRLSRSWFSLQDDGCVGGPWMTVSKSRRWKRQLLILRWT
ncbi:MAG: right-handed parallel beta-helix repeat-containing protein, partial [bacterium]|nr:right-handed parallel beta-helix repeat-containing protein [bacterium]